MARTADFPLRSSYAAQKQMAQLAFTLLRMQAATPAGESGSVRVPWRGRRPRRISS